MHPKSKNTVPKPGTLHKIHFGEDWGFAYVSSQNCEKWAVPTNYDFKVGDDVDLYDHDQADDDEGMVGMQDHWSQNWVEETKVLLQLSG